MNPVMYIFLNRGLGMTEGKIGAQCGHAVSRAEAQSKPHLHAEWKRGMHETKLVMLAEDEQHMLIIERYIRDRGFHTELIIDEGRTEVKPHTITAMGVEIVDKDDPQVQATFSDFKLYKKKKVPKKTPWYRRKGS
jgi:peptidyl-tRNA hydrolase